MWTAGLRKHVDKQTTKTIPVHLQHARTHKHTHIHENTNTHTHKFGTTTGDESKREHQAGHVRSQEHEIGLLLRSFEEIKYITIKINTIPSQYK